MGMKICTSCKELKNPKDFYKLGQDRIDSWCKDCKRSKRVARYDSKQEVRNYGNFRKLLDFMTEIKLSELSGFEQELEGIISNAIGKNSSAI